MLSFKLSLSLACITLPSPEVILWTFTSKASNLTGFRITTVDNSNVVIIWDDNTDSTYAASGVGISHSYSS